GPKPLCHLLVAAGVELAIDATWPEEAHRDGPCRTIKRFRKQTVITGLQHRQEHVRDGGKTCREQYCPRALLDLGQRVFERERRRRAAGAVGEDALVSLTPLTDGLQGACVAVE